MSETEKILESLGLKCTLGSWRDEKSGQHHAICYNRKQGNTWVRKLEKAGYTAWLFYEQYAYTVTFYKK